MGTKPTPRWRAIIAKIRAPARSITTTLAIPPPPSYAIPRATAYNTRNNRTRDNVTVKGDYILSPKNSFTLSPIWNRDKLDRPTLAITFDLSPPCKTTRPS